MIEIQNTEMIAFVTRHYHWLVEPVIYMFQKYFDIPLTFFSDRPILGHKVIEVFPRDMHIYQEPCGKLIKAALREVDKLLVYILLLDELPISSMDLHRYHILETYMMEHTNVARANLKMCHENAVRDCGVLLYEYPELSIVRIPDTDLHIGQLGASSLNPALWRKDFLLEFIEDDWTFDAIEYPGQHKFMAQSKWHSIGTLPALMNYSHLCFTAQPRVVWLSSIPDDEDGAFVAQFVPEGHIIT